jgi:hypothetical protein
MAKVVAKKNDDILVISDLHTPFHHPDALSFLAALKEKYKFGRVVCVGDECDFQNMSYHDSNPDLPSAGDELIRAKGTLRELYHLFPIMDLIESNHGSMAFRKALTHGFPRHAITSYGDMIFGERDKYGNIYRPTSLGIGWVWHKKLVIDLGGGHMCLVVHGDGTPANSLNSVKQAGMSFISGHHHSRFDIQYHSTSEFLHFGMICGCLIDPHSAAFDYGAKRVLTRPIIGCGGVIDGVPRLFPMQLNDKGRWTKAVP